MISVEISTEIIYWSDGSLSSSDTKRLHRNAVLRAVLCLDEEVAMPRQHLPKFDKSSSLDARLASGLCVGHAESMYVRYSQNDLRQPRPHGNQNGRQFTCIFDIVDSCCSQL